MYNTITHTPPHHPLRARGWGSVDVGGLLVCVVCFNYSVWFLKGLTLLVCCWGVFYFVGMKQEGKGVVHRVCVCYSSAS